MSQVSNRNNIRSSLENIVSLIKDKYFCDEEQNVLVGVLSYLGRRNLLLLGNHGTGKTTYSSVISSCMSGLPFDLFDKLKIQGHPDQTKDAMLARVDLGRLAEEGTIWQASVYLPALCIDEINRLPPGKQAILMEYIRTGQIEHLNKIFTRGKIPFFATMNYNGPGTYPLPAPQYDRFDASIELGQLKTYLFNAVKGMKKNIVSELADPNRTNEIMKRLLERDSSIDDKLKFLKSQSNPRMTVNLEEFEALIDKMQYEPEAEIFQRCINAEINFTKLYGVNRTVDPRDTSSHNKDYASSKCTGPLSDRGLDALDFYSRGFALFAGSEKVRIQDIKAAATFTLSHRLNFTDDYKAVKHGAQRTAMEDKHLTSCLLDEIKANYDGVANELRRYDNAISQAEKTNDEEGVRVLKSEVGEAIRKNVAPDHPLQREFWEYCRKLCGIGNRR